MKGIGLKDLGTLSIVTRTINQIPSHLLFSFSNSIESQHAKSFLSTKFVLVGWFGVVGGWLSFILVFSQKLYMHHNNHSV